MKMSEKLDLKSVRIYSNTKDDVVDAINLIGEEVYLSDYGDFRSYREGNLEEVSYANNISYPFLGECGVGAYKYFILAKDVKFKEEKILRPFKDVKEFVKETECAIGNVITYKKKGSDAEYTVIFNGYVRINDNVLDNVLGIYLGRRSYTFEELKDDYLYLCVDEWKPFGVIE